MTEQKRKAMLILANTLMGEINRMCDTEDLSEFDAIYGRTKKLLDGLSKMIYDSRFRKGEGMSESTNTDREHLSVANDIAALALINIQDIFYFVLTAKDDEIEERYGSERTAINIAETYLEIAMKAPILEHRLSGWSMKYSQPIKDSDERKETTAYFYDVKNKPESEP